MASNETLASQITLMKEQRIEDRIIDSKAHSAILDAVKDLSKDVKALDKKFVLRREFIAVSSVIGIGAIIIGIIGSLNGG